MSMLKVCRLKYIAPWVALMATRNTGPIASSISEPATKSWHQSTVRRRTKSERNTAFLPSHSC